MSSVSGSSSVFSHESAFQKITGINANADTNQSTAEAICWSEAALRPPATWEKFG